jgi:hypothetical protein
MDHTRAIRPPPGARRNLFQSNRRQNPTTTVRPDTAGSIIQPGQDELVERLPSGEYALFAPQTVYKHMALGLGNGSESDEETGMLALSPIAVQYWAESSISNL